jgi:CBS domain-containing protein
MNVGQLMTRTVHACHPQDSLNIAADIMWKHDCGCVPVVVDEDGGARVVGMLTDRDVCMAAYTQGRALDAITAANAMSPEVRSCRPTDSIRTALDVLRTNQLHRLPIVDANDHLVGMFSLADLAREAAREHGRRGAEVKDQDVAETVEAISRSRSKGDVVCAA